jgi:translation initiation factor 5B
MNILENKTENKLSPVCCVLGHVNVGKTQLLDKLRKSSICKNEIGELTQQIGTTYFTAEILSQLANNVANLLEIPGLLMIDTPGHDCFSQMRMIGANVSHLAILVVDILKGLEEQTLKCIELLKSNNIRFIIVMNKMDKIYGWKKTNDATLKKTFSNQGKATISLLKQYSDKIVYQLSEVGENACLYYDNKNVDEYISMIPISAVSGEGIADLIILISKLTTRNFKKIVSAPNSIYKICHGYIIDIKQDDKSGLLCYAILMNDCLSKNDTILIQGTNNELWEGDIKEIFVPNTKKEMKNANLVTTVNTIYGTIGVGIKLKSHINDIMLGGLFMKVNNNIDELKIHMKGIVKNNIKDENNHLEYQFEQTGITVNVTSKSMGDAVMQMINAENNIKINNLHIGKIDKTLIIKTSRMNSISDIYSIDYIYAKRYTVILDYTNETYDNELLSFAKSLNVHIITDSIIYKLFEKYNNYIKELDNIIRSKVHGFKKSFELTILPQYIFMKKPPLIGIKVTKGELQIGSPVEAFNNKTNKRIILGKIISIQQNKKEIMSAKIGDDVCIKIDIENNDIEYGKQFDNSFIIINYISPEDKVIMSKYQSIFDIIP